MVDFRNPRHFHGDYDHLGRDFKPSEIRCQRQYAPDGYQHLYSVHSALDSG